MADLVQSSLGDLIIIWRVFAFYQVGKARWVIAFPISLLSGSLGTRALSLLYTHIHYHFSDIWAHLILCRTLG